MLWNTEPTASRMPQQASGCFGRLCLALRLIMAMREYDD